MRTEWVTTIVAADTPSDGTILDLLALPEGMFLYDIHLHVKEGWDNDAACDFGFALNTGTPRPILAGGQTAPLGANAADDNPIMSGNANAFYPADILHIGASYGTPYLPTIAIQDGAVLQFRYLSGGFGDPPTTGEVEIRVILEDAQDPPAPPPDPPDPGSLAFPGEHIGGDNSSVNELNILARFHIARWSTITVTLDSDLPAGYLGVTDPTGNGPVGVGGDQSYFADPLVAGDYVFHVSAGDWMAYWTTFGDYEPTLTGSGSYSVTYP